MINRKPLSADAERRRNEALARGRAIAAANRAAGGGSNLSITAAIKRVLDKTNNLTRRKYSEMLAEALVDSAIAGNVQAAREILDRVDGKVESKQEAGVSAIGAIVQALAAAREAGLLPRPSIPAEVVPDPVPSIADSTHVAIADDGGGVADDSGHSGGL